MKLLVEVTQEDIDEGVCADPELCMLHRAIERCSEGVMSGPGLLVMGTHVTWQPAPHTLCLIELPKVVQWQIRGWDTGCETLPFSFELEIPEAGPSAWWLKEGDSLIEVRA